MSNYRPSLDRREFLKIWSSSMGAVALQPLRQALPPEDKIDPMGVGRVTISAIGLYQEPSFSSQRIKWLGRDKLVDIIAEAYGSTTNPHWYRIVGGYAHSAYIQRVEDSKLNKPISRIPQHGQLGEITVPYSQALREVYPGRWQPVYRLYFGSVYWITHLIEGPDNKPWYGLTDDRLRLQYYIPASHMRPIPPDELKAISPRVPPENKRIVLSIAEQCLYAYEYDREVFRATVSTGIPSRGPSPNGIPSDTPIGNFHISRKTPSRHMGDGNLTSDLEAYELPGVPWVSYFQSYGIGFHGTYWHNNFGWPMSHGCVNMRNEDARWIYRWTTPPTSYSDWYKLGRGTFVQVI
jgi:hypothetical protein